MKSNDFLLEIGCEELPADYLPVVFDTAVLAGAGVKWKEVFTFATPRRLVLRLTAVEPVVKKKERGPPVQVAFDAQGRPARAAEAFAQKHNLKVTQLTREQTPKGEVLFAEYDVPVAKILAETVPELIQGIHFPKTMRWDESGVRFARPIRWLIALYGPQVVPVVFGLLHAGRQTFPNRRLGAKPVAVLSASAYFSLLPKLKVQLLEGKREALRVKLEAAANKLRGRLPDETTEEFEWLLNTVTFLAEDPVVAVGSFRPEYLELPPEVLQTSMAKHLKLFSIRSATSGKLLPHFLAVLEGKPKNPAGVMANVDRIIEARFTDARFFYKEDTKTRLEAKVPQMERVSFHEKLGTVAERIPRLEKIAASVASMTGLSSEGISRVARLAKVDLVTQMVREFPALQGTIGGHYARHDGEPAEVAAAIAQQYWPRAAKDPVPTTPLAALISLADRVDALAGYFGVGLKPTGSADPYGLRRLALGLVRILIEPPKGVSFVGLSFDRLFDESIQSWGARITLDPKTLKKELRAFLRERFEWLATREAPGDRELVAAILAAGDDDLAGAWERLQLLRRLWAGSGDGKRKILEAAAKVADRTGRIVKSVKGLPLPDAVDPAILKEPEEKELWETWNRIAPQVKEQLERRQYEEATRIYSGLYPAVHAYFEKVFVMAEDEALRRNRLALLKQIHGSLAGAFADLGRLSLPGTLEN
ncbi:MAG: glycine--tRNA ligase subunit beta [Candidatus Omnitrophota bacterium]|nr:glycine--tRNA ligase subunit beta [Candidatus Omnitrophota bacterium]